MCLQNASHLVNHLELGAKYINIKCLKIVQKALKWPLQHVNIQTLSWKACPGTPLEPFLFLNLLQIKSFGKNYAWKNIEIWCLLPEKNSEHAPNRKQFQRVYLRSFPGLNVIRFCT